MADLRAKLQAAAARPHGQHAWAKRMTDQHGHRVRQGDWRAVSRLDSEADEMIVDIIARTDDTVTLSATDYETLLTAAEDVEDICTLRAAEARDAEVGKDAARADNLPDEFVGRLLAGEHPIRI